MIDPITDPLGPATTPDGPPTWAELKPPWRRLVHAYIESRKNKGLGMRVLNISERFYRCDPLLKRWRYLSDADLEAQLVHEATVKRDTDINHDGGWRLFPAVSPDDLGKARRMLARLFHWPESNSERAGLPTDAPWDLHQNVAIELTRGRVPGQVLSLDLYPRQLRGVLAFDDGWLTLARPERLLPYEERFFIPRALPYDFADVYARAEAGVAGTMKSAHPAFDAFLAETFAGDEFGECVALVWEWLGYLASGSNAHQRALVCFGPRNAGKSVFALLIGAIFGEAVTRMDSARLASQFGTSILEGRTIAIVDEADPTKLDRAKQSAWSELVNSISGGMPVVVERKHKDPRTAHLGVRFMFVANVPIIDPINPEGWSRRALYLPFRNEVPPDRIDPSLAENLIAEAPAILATSLRYYMLHETERDMKSGVELSPAEVAQFPEMAVPPPFTEPPSSRELRHALYAERSAMSVFIEARCVLEPDAWTSSKALLAAYNNWAPELNAPAGRQPSFGRELLRTLPGVIRRKRDRERPGGQRIAGYSGIRVKPQHGGAGDTFAV